VLAAESRLLEIDVLVHFAYAKREAQELPLREPGALKGG
jgi:hypothetical protein